MIAVRFSATKKNSCVQYCTSGKLHKIIIFFTFREFSVKIRLCQIVGFGMFYKPKKYDENLQSHFFLDNEKFNFLNKTTHNCEVCSKTKNHLEIFARDL